VYILDRFIFYYYLFMPSLSVILASAVCLGSHPLSLFFPQLPWIPPGHRNTAPLVAFAPSVCPKRQDPTVKYKPLIACLPPSCLVLTSSVLNLVAMSPTRLHHCGEGQSAKLSFTVNCNAASSIRFYFTRCATFAPQHQHFLKSFWHPSRHLCTYWVPPGHTFPVIHVT
jgi:hypothetical protein